MSTMRDGNDTAIYNDNEVAKELGIEIPKPVSVHECRELIICRDVNMKGMHKNPLPKVDINGFFQLVQNALIDAQTNSGIPEKYWCSYWQDFPDFGDKEDGDDVNVIDKLTDGIIYKVSDRRLGTFKQGPIQQTEGVNIKPIPREHRVVPFDSAYDVEVSGQFWTTLVKFTAFSTKAMIADERAIWFEDFMYDYLWYFEMHGCKVVYDRRLEDFADTIHKQVVKQRPIRYYIRTEKIYHKLLKKLDSVDLHYSMGNNVEVLQRGNKIYQTMKGLNK